MAKEPDINNGHIDIANELAEALTKVNLSGYQYRIIWCIFRKTYGWHKSTDKISLTQFEKMTGIERRHIQRALRKLESLNMIIIDRNSYINTYKFNSHYDTWKIIDSAKIGTSAKIGAKVVPKEATLIVPKEVHTKEKKETIQKKDIYRSDDSIDDFYKEDKNKETKKQIEEIVSYLNEKTGKNFRSNKADTIKTITARLNEGYKIDDLKKAIDIKTSEWKDTEYDKYLRPKTLFGNKFEGYLNEKPIKKGVNKNGYIERDRSAEWFDEFQRRKSNKSKPAKA